MHLPESLATIKDSGVRSGRGGGSSSSSGSGGVADWRDRDMHGTAQQQNYRPFGDSELAALAQPHTRDGGETPLNCS